MVKYVIRYTSGRKETVECDDLQQRGDATVFLRYSAVEVDTDGTPKATLVRLVNFREVVDVHLVEDVATVPASDLSKN